MNIADVTSRFAMFAGLENSEIYEWKSLIDDACCYVGSLVKKDIKNKSDELRINALCALYAYRLYCLCGRKEISSFTAGDVSIASFSGDFENADRLWKEYRAECEDLIGRDGFLFGRVM